MTVMKYKVALKKTKEGYSVSCPGLPGCWSQGKTEREALENIQFAIREYLEAVAIISKGSKIREVEVLVNKTMEPTQKTRGSSLSH